LLWKYLNHHILFFLKRVFLHIGFWISYLAQDVTLIYHWDKQTLSKFSVGQHLLITLENCSVSLIPKILFAYYLIYNAVPKLLTGKNEREKNILYLILVLISTVLFYRAIAVFFIFPVIYHGLISNSPYFNVGDLLQMLMDVGFAAGAATVIKQIRLQLEVKEREKNLIRDKLETELKFLRNQTNPHFLFNTLNNIYALARKKSDDTADVVMKLSKLLRFMLYESKKNLIKISDEIKMLDDYVELEKIRYNDRLTISFLREIDNEHEQIAPLLLLPFVENAFKHGASESRFESFINMDMKLQDRVLLFYIENTKEVGSKNPNGENIGLANVKRQLELLYKDHEISIENEPSFFKVSLKIDLSSYASI
jgi:two-component system LytT family sensor kinase